MITHKTLLLSIPLVALIFLYPAYAGNFNPEFLEFCGGSKVIAYLVAVGTWALIMGGMVLATKNVGVRNSDLK